MYHPFPNRQSIHSLTNYPSIPLLLSFLTQLHILADDYFQWSIRGNVKRQISSKLLQALGPLSVWTPDKVEMLGTYIAYLPRSTLKSQLTADFVLVNLPFIETIEEMDEVEEKALGIAAWNLADAMMNNPSFVTPDEKRRALCMIAKFAPRKAIFDTLYTPDEIKEGLKGCKHWNISKENSGRALSNVFSMNNFTWDNDTISMMADFSQAISTTTFDTMDAHTLQHNWDRMRDSNLSMPVLTDVDCRDIHTMGRMFFALSVAELNQIPDPALGECGAHIGMMMDVMCDETPMVCNKIWEKVKRHNSSRGDSLGGVITSMGPGVLRFVPSDDLRDLSLDDLGGLDNLKNLDLDAAQSEVVMEIVEREFGAVSKDNMNYTGAQVEKLGHVFFKGASSESLQELPEGMELMETLPSIVANLEHMNDKKIKVVYDKLHTMFGMDKGTEVCLDESTVKQAAGFFSQATHDDLMQLDRDTRLSVLSEIGQSGDVVKTMTREGIKEHFKTLKEAENLNTRGSFTSSDLEKYGPHIFCGMDATDAQKLSTAAVDNFLQELDECEQLDSDTRTVIAQKAVNSASGLSGLANDPQKLESMGTLMLHVDMSGAANLRSDQKERLGSVVGDVMERVNKREKRLEQRSSSDIPKAEKTDEKMLQNNMARALWDVVADTIDCQTIQSFHGDLSFLTTADLTVIEADVVVECLTEFQNTDWDQDQLDTLGWKIKTQFGNDTGMWDKKTIMEAGKILGGLDPDDIQKMTLDKDIMGVLGQFQIADPEAMFQKFAQDEGLGNMSAVDADTMRSFGSMLCGMSAGDMMDLQSTVVLEVAKDLSTIDCLTKDQVKAIASRLEDAIPSNQWNQVSVEEMGVLAGGLEADKLEQLDDDQVSAISPKAIKVMKPDTFTKAFNADKMSKLTQDQVSAISPNMLRKMDIGQLIAIESVANGTRGVNATQMAANRTAYFHIEIPTNVSVKDLGTFQEVRNLRNDTGCLSGMSFGGQADDLLDTVDKQDAFALTLPPDHETLFDRLRASPDHDVGIFTTFEMRMVLEYLMDNLDPAGRDTYLDLLAQFPTLTRDEVNHTVTTWPPRLHLLMKPHLMCSTLGQMDVEVLNNFCEHLTDEDVSTATVIEMLNRCGDCLAVAHASRTDEGIIGLMSGFKGRAFYDKLAQWKSDGWDLYHLMFAPDTLEVEDVDRITDHSNYLDIAQIARLGNERFYEMTSDEVKQRLAQRLSEQLGELSDWSYLRQSMLLPYIVNMPPKVLKRQLTPSMVFSFLPYMEDILEVANKKFLKISAWKVAKYLIANSDTVTREMKQEAVCLVLEFSTHKKLWKKVYSANDLFSYMPGCVAYGVSEKRITEVVKKVIRSNAFEWNQEGIEMIAPFIAAVPKSLLKNVNASLLYDNWGLFSNANFSMGTLRMLWKRVQSKVVLASVTCNEIQRLGRVFLALRVNEMNQISDVTMHECLGYLGEIMEDSCSENKWLCKNVWDKVKKYIKRQGVGIGTVIKHLGAGFVRYLPREDMEEIDLSDLGDLTTLSDLKVNIEHAPIFMRKVVGVKGPISLSNTNYSAHALMQLGSVFYHGATGPEFEFLPEDPSLFEMLPDMAMHFADINEKKIEIVYSKIKKILGVNTTTDICLDRALAEQVAMFFTAASADDLRKFSVDTRKVIIKTIGQRYDFVKRMTRQKIQEIFSVMMELDSLGSKGSYDENDMEEFGYMWCGQKSTQAFKLSETAIDQFMGVLKDCVHFEPNTRGALVSKSISISGGLSSLLQNNP
ncbi:uncharacterized protein LOC101855140, partial [Aplysia californica]|uniref:Uncharacterized protein LOC101855140 n=1 Tax=Aplysia californica TaxID=6500 RepID=A0ABM1W124_APLCA